ncbi:MAG: GspH/FimT family pseudopilin [Gammaproteobacteria bacterium]|nr:GspH/FimT family pseudopilin [Gammaproteobacteria bacterium]
MRKGLSLLEMLFVIAIMCILVALAATQRGLFLTKSKDEVIRSKLLRAIDVARSESALLGVNISLCPSKDHMNCGGEWNDGQVVFIDSDLSGTINGKEHVLYVFDAHSRDGSLYWRSALHRNYLMFSPAGMSYGEDGTFWYCSGKRKLAWAIKVNQAGRARVVYPDYNGKIDSLGC